MRSNTYKEEKAWKEIQSYLPEENRLNDDTLPEEMYMKIEEYDVHIDRYVHENPKGIVVLFHGVGGNGRLFYDKLRINKKMTMLPGAGHFSIEKVGLTEFETACIGFLDNLNCVRILTTLP